MNRCYKLVYEMRRKKIEKGMFLIPAISFGGTFSRIENKPRTRAVRYSLRTGMGRRWHSSAVRSTAADRTHDLKEHRPSSRVTII